MGVSAKLCLILSCIHLFLGFSTSADSQSVVEFLPGYVGALPFELETGYVSIDDSDDVHLFYYFVKSENNPAEDPLLFWISGGPGCSGLTAFFFEFGPMQIKVAKYNGSLPELGLNPHSWTKVSNVIFIDSPVASGFSYSSSLQGLYTSDTKSAQQASIFIAKWLTSHPEYLSNHLYVGGDSYAGLIVPMVVQDISDGIEAGNKPPLNLKGYILGNAMTDPDNIESHSLVPYVHGMGLISDELLESVKKSCGENYVNVDPKNILCAKAFEEVSECISGVNTAHILEPRCLLVTPKPNNIAKYGRFLEEKLNEYIYSPPKVPEFECRSYAYMLSYYWANDHRVRKALHIRKETVSEWTRCKFGGTYYSKNVRNTIGYHLNLSKKNYRSLIYSGDHDMLVTFLGTQAWIRSLNLSITEKWRPWIVTSQVAGYAKTYTNKMTFATVKGGGHTAPEYRPKECLAMIKRWMSYEPL